MAFDTLIGAENRSGRVKTVETGPKIGEPSRTAAGRRESFAPSRAEGPPAPLCATWQNQSAPRRAVCVGSRRRLHSGSGRLL